jgi:hypothetical protein
MGIEPTSEAWEASILPLYDARSDHYASKTLQALQVGECLIVPSSLRGKCLDRAKNELLFPI